MREIKFRAWGKFGKDILPHMVYDWETSDLIEYVGFNGNGYFDIMQYTGLKDKNGKEIYEGDILRDDRDEIRIVEWRVGEDDEVRNYIAGFWLFYEPDEYEVIGNIYENPELIKDKP